LITTDILVIGLGPTGLGAAWRLDALGHADWIACEADPVAGGLAGSVVDDHGFTWDFGGHVQFSHYEYFDTLMDELLGEDGWYHHDRESWVWVRDRFVPYPFQLNLHRLPEGDATRAIAGLVHAARQAAEGAPPPADFGAWIDAAFGEGIADVFMRPYNTKVWARDPERMAWHWIGDRVALVDLPRVVENVRLDRDDVSWGPNNRFRFPRRGGTGAIWRALAARLTGRHSSRMQFGRRLASLDTVARRAVFTDGSVIGYRRLLSTMAIDELTALSDLVTTLTPALAELEYSSTHVIGVGLRGRAPSALEGKCWMYFPESNCPFYRVTHFSHYSPQNVADPSTQWSLMAEVSESTHRPLRRADVVADTIDGMLATGLVANRADVHHTWHRRLERGYPVPSLHRDRALARLQPAFEARDVLSRGRFGAWKYEVSNQDHSFAQGVEAIDRWLTGGEEETLHHPDRVNARRPPSRPLQEHHS
jgi:protoporphyrinogen oxidase